MNLPAPDSTAEELSSLPPRITALAFASPRHLALTVTAGEIGGGVQLPYVPRTGDEIVVAPEKEHERRVLRGGRYLGLLIADRTGPKLWVPEAIQGVALDLALAKDPRSYSLMSLGAVDAMIPQHVHHKCRPINATDPGLNFVIEHQLFLEFAADLQLGRTYRLTFTDRLFSEPSRAFDFEPDRVKSPAVHASQVGHHPDDQSKRAYLSLWMGGAAIDYGNPEFSLLNTATGERVFEGVGKRAGGGEATSLGSDDTISIHAPVWHLDYSSVTTSGTYVVIVKGVGASYPFPIGKQAWTEAFRVSMRGLFHHRSGVELGPPYTEYRRPRPYHPADGTLVYHSDCSLFESGNGLNAYRTDKDNFGNLVKGKTNRLVGEAWGGYFDACDWDRRIPHLYATRLGLELFFMRPKHVSSWNLHLPESGNGIPDLLNEGCWNLDVYRRMQTAQGGIRGGIEANEHPLPGQCSWQETLTVMAYAPDFWSSHLYAATAAMMAIALEGINDELHAAYKESSLRAMNWAEDEYCAKIAERDQWSPRAQKETVQARNLAIIWKMKLTDSVGSSAMIDRRMLLQDVHACFAYSQLPEAVCDGMIKAECINSILKAAESGLHNGESNPYNLSFAGSKAYAGPYNTFYSVPGCIPMIYAHHLTGEARFLEGALLSAHFSCGANPLDMIYTTGIGASGPRAVLHHDSRRTGQRVPSGITVYGNYNLARHGKAGEISKVRRAGALQPDAQHWPSVESYLDIYLFPSQNEYTIMQTIGPTSFVWGYFAAR